jgi:hypothetical protein
MESLPGVLGALAGDCRKRRQQFQARGLGGTVKTKLDQGPGQLRQKECLAFQRVDAGEIGSLAVQKLPAATLAPLGDNRNSRATESVHVTMDGPR